MGNRNLGRSLYKNASSLRVLVLVGAFVVVSLLASGIMLGPSVTWLTKGTAETDYITSYENRFRAVREIVSGKGSVGYISYTNLNVVDSGFHLFLTQYSLAPTLVDRNSSSNWVIGNFPLVEGEPIRPSLSGFQVIRDFGDGVVLLEKDSSQ